MIQELINVYEKVQEKSRKSLIIESYVPDSGTYILVNQDGSIEGMIDVSVDKKTENLILDGDKKLDKEIYIRDYFSKILSTNKAMDKKKKIHSNNPFAVFIKKDVLEKKIVDENILNGYYDSLLHAKDNYQTKPKSYEMYQKAESIVGDYPREKAELCRKWVIDHIFRLDIDLNKGKYLKILFNYPIEMYEREYKRYLYPRLFMKNENNKVINDQIYGLPGNNFNLNCNKPFLQHVGRKISEPTLIPIDMAIREKELFDYLMNLANFGFYNIFFDTTKNEIMSYKNGILPEQDFSGYYIRTHKGKKMEVDIIYSVNISDFHPLLEEAFHLHNYMNIKEEESCTYTTKQELHDMINEIMFSWQLQNGYFSELSSSQESFLLKELVQNREILFQWFYTGADIDIDSLLDSLYRIILCNIETNAIKKAAKQMNLYLSLCAYYNKSFISPYQLWEQCLKKIYVCEDKNVEADILDKNELYFFIGKLLKLMYLSMKNKSKILLFLKDSKHFKRNMQVLCNKYLTFNSYMQKRIYSFVVQEKRLDTNMNYIILAGLLYRYHD